MGRSWDAALYLVDHSAIPELGCSDCAHVHSHLVVVEFVVVGVVGVNLAQVLTLDVVLHPFPYICYPLFDLKVYRRRLGS